MPKLHFLDRLLHQGPAGTNSHGERDFYKRTGEPDCPMATLTMSYDDDTSNLFGYDCHWTEGWRILQGNLTGRTSKAINLYHVVGNPARSVAFLEWLKDDDWVVQMALSENEDGSGYVPRFGSDRPQKALSIPDHILADVILQSMSRVDADSWLKPDKIVVSCIVAAFMHQTRGLPTPKWSEADYAYAPAFLGDLVVSALEVLSSDDVKKIGHDWKKSIEEWFKSTGQATSNAGVAYDFADVDPYVESNWDAWQAARKASWEDQTRALVSRRQVGAVSAAGASASATAV